MRAIFINAVDRKVEEVQIENNLEAFYEKIGCEMIEVLQIGGNHLASSTRRGNSGIGKRDSDFPNRRASPETR